MDILGIKNEMYKSENNTDKKIQILGLYKKIKTDLEKHINESQEHQLSREASDFKILSFSDSIVFSAKPDTISFRFFLQQILYIQRWLLLEQGYFLRGGIAYGEIYHDMDGIVLGKALIVAHELESKYAIYPRIVMCRSEYENLLADGKYTPKQSDSRKDIKSKKEVCDEMCSAIEKLLKKDSDGFMYIDYIGKEITEWSDILNVNDMDMLKNIKNKVQNNIKQNSDNESILQKMDWILSKIYECDKRIKNDL